MKSILFLVFSLSLFAGSNGVVYDKKLHLMWEDGKNVSTKFSNWEEAKRYCERLKLSGFDDWRLPNIEELSSVLDMNRYMPAIKSEFKSVAKDDYWTSTPDAGDFKFVWAVDFGSGIDNRNAKTNLHLTRCVREQR